MNGRARVEVSDDLVNSEELQILFDYASLNWLYRAIRLGVLPVFTFKVKGQVFAKRDAVTRHLLHRAQLELEREEKIRKRYKSIEAEKVERHLAALEKERLRRKAKDRARYLRGKEAMDREVEAKIAELKQSASA